MKKLTAILLVVSIITIFSACSSNKPVEQVGPYEADSYSLSVPEGWVQTTAEGNLVFAMADYPEHPSYILVSASANKQVDELLKSKDQVIDAVKKQMIEKIGEGSDAEVPTYEETEVNGTRCVHTVLTYTTDGQSVFQDQYSFDTSTGGATFTFASIGDDNFKAEFEKSIASIKIK